MNSMKYLKQIQHLIVNIIVAQYFTYYLGEKYLLFICVEASEWICWGCNGGRNSNINQLHIIWQVSSVHFTNSQFRNKWFKEYVYSTVSAVHSIHCVIRLTIRESFFHIYWEIIWVAWIKLSYKLLYQQFLWLFGSCSLRLRSFGPNEKTNR